MKLRRILLSSLAIIILSSCNKEVEVYEKKDIKVESVFDNIEKKNEEKEKSKEKKEEKKEDKKEKADNEDIKIEEKVNEKLEETTQNVVNIKQAAVLVNMRETPTTNEENFILSIPEGDRMKFSSDRKSVV